MPRTNCMLAQCAITAALNLRGLRLNMTRC